MHSFQIKLNLFFLSRLRYGPSSIRYQVASGQSLSAPPWKGVFKKKDQVESGLDISSDNMEASDDVPSAPSAHLTAKDIVYEVDVDIPDDEEEKKEEDERESLVLESMTEESDKDEAEGTPITARDYGQKGRGALVEYVLSKQGLKTSSIESFRTSSASREPSLQTDLEPPQPGRLRLLSGVSASFEPGTLNALMGESGAGKKHLCLEHISSEHILISFPLHIDR